MNLCRQLVVFNNRLHAARELEKSLSMYKGTNSVILAIPRGGVVIGHHLSKALILPLDLLMSKKIGHPSNKEYAIGSVTMSDVIINQNVSGVDESYIESESRKIQGSLAARYKKFRGERTPLMLTGKNVIVVDDGIATGLTVEVCLQTLRVQHPAKVILAVPVAPPESIQRLQACADEIICLYQPEHFQAVGEFYDHFDEISDDLVKRLMDDLAENR